MTTIQLMACIGMVVGFFVLLGITPSDFTEGVFRQITSKPKSLRDEINESTQRKKKFVLRREIEESQNILRMTGREAKFPAICAMSLLLFLVGASFAFLLGNLFLVPVLAAGMMFIPFWYIKLTAAYFKRQSPQNWKQHFPLLPHPISVMRTSRPQSRRIWNTSIHRSKTPLPSF